MHRFRQGIGWLVVGLAHVGCSAQADPEYQGEPLATVVGTVVTTEAPPSGEIDAALLWLSYDPLDPSLKIANTVVRGSFPAAFTLEVLAPPPPERVVSAEGIRFGIIAAVRHQSARTVSFADVLGTALNVVVVYFPNDATGENDVIAEEAARLRVPPTRGYHLARVIVTEEAEATAYRCESDGLCVHTIIGGGDGSHDFTPEEFAVWQAQEDESFALCTKYSPDASRCDITANDPMDHPEEEACRALAQARSERQNQRFISEGEAAFCPTAWAHVPNPEEFASPVTISLGTTIHDVLYPRYRD